MGWVRAQIGQHHQRYTELSRELECLENGDSIRRLIKLIVPENLGITLTAPTYELKRDCLLIWMIHKGFYTSGQEASFGSAIISIAESGIMTSDPIDQQFPIGDLLTVPDIYE